MTDRDPFKLKKVCYNCGIEIQSLFFKSFGYCQECFDNKMDPRPFEDGSIEGLFDEDERE